MLNKAEGFNFGEGSKEFIYLRLLRIFMKVVLSHHARKRLIERGIKMQDVQETIEIPDYTMSRTIQ